MMDKIVAVTQFEDYVLIFTEHGKIYRLKISRLDYQIHIQLLTQMDLK